MSGIAELPLHQGGVPQWLISRMIKLAYYIVKLIIDEYGHENVLQRLANPLWFQALSNAIGMDWDSSGSTTVTCAVLKHVFNSNDLGIKAAGGKGSHALKTLDEIERVCKELGIESLENQLKYTSRITAKVDSTAIQDGYSIYHHMIFVDSNGHWVVIQQGMNLNTKTARRYHWCWEKIKQKFSYVIDPHEGICGVKHDKVLNLVSSTSIQCQKVIVELVHEHPNKIIRLVKYLKARIEGLKDITEFLSLNTREKGEPYGRDIIQKFYRDEIQRLSVNEKALYKAFEIKPNSFEELLLIEGLGPQTLRSLALISELIYGTKPSWDDPVTHVINPFKYSFVVGGKDGVPYPINKKLYDEILSFMEKIVECRNLEDKYKRMIFKNLNRFIKLHKLEE